MFEVIKIKTYRDGKKYAKVIWQGLNKKEYKGSLGCFLSEEDWSPTAYLMRTKDSNEISEWLKDVTFYSDNQRGTK
jgi:hypothetical protein